MLAVIEVYNTAIYKANQKDKGKNLYQNVSRKSEKLF